MYSSLSSSASKIEPEELEMNSVKSKIPSKPTEDHETAYSKDADITEVKTRAGTVGSTTSGENANKGGEKEKEESSDIADGSDPLSQDSFRPLLSGNQYSMRKTASQALMDVALMMANISQLRTLLTAGDSLQYSVLLIVMVSLSLGFQVLFAILIFLIWMRESEQHQRDEYLNALREVTENTPGTTASVKDKIRITILRRQKSYEGHRLTSYLNYISMVLVFIITVINMFVTGFGIKLESPANSDEKTAPN